MSDQDLMDFLESGEVVYLGEDEWGGWRCDCISGPVGQGDTARGAIRDAITKTKFKVVTK